LFSRYHFNDPSRNDFACSGTSVNAYDDILKLNWK